MVTLYPHQQQLLDRNPPKHLLSFDTGTGKTILSIALAEKNLVRCLVVVPKALKEQWQEEVNKYGDKVDYFIVTKEEFKRDLLKLKGFDGIIIDEAHHFLGIKSKFHKNLVWFLKKHQLRYVWLLTATPYLSTPWNIYAAAKLLGHEWDRREFEYKFFFFFPMGNRIIPKVRENIDVKQDLAEMMKPFTTSVDMKDIVEVPEQTMNVEYFEKTEDQIRGIEALTDSAFITFWTKQHQIENGLLYEDGAETTYFEAKKNEAIFDIVKKERKVAIFARYNAQLVGLSHLLENSGKRIFTITGATEDRHSVVKQANASDECVVLIQAECCEGYELPTIHAIIFASLSFSWKSFKQACGRFLRVNRLVENTYHILITRGVDEQVYECINEKRDFHIEVYKSNKQ